MGCRNCVSCRARPDGLPGTPARAPSRSYLPLDEGDDYVCSVLVTGRDGRRPLWPSGPSAGSTSSGTSPLVALCGAWTRPRGARVVPSLERPLFIFCWQRCHDRPPRREDPGPRDGFLRRPSTGDLRAVLVAGRHDPSFRRERQPVMLWSARRRACGPQAPAHSLTDHTAAVKALAWFPRPPRAGVGRRHGPHGIKLWNASRVNLNR